ncbi:HdeD family acid-resistance protein [Rhodovibrionaceae bacterium A322]
MGQTDPDLESLGQRMVKGVQENATLFIFEAIALILVGTAAIVLPVVATYTVTLFVGAILLVAGVVQVISALKHRNSSGFWFPLVTGVLGIVIGLMILLDISAGATSLTLLLIIMFTLEGVTKIIAAFDARKHLANWGWLALNGLVSVFLAAFIWAQLPLSAAWFLGLMLGINLIFSGFAQIMLVMAAKRLQ